MKSSRIPRPRSRPATVQVVAWGPPEAPRPYAPRPYASAASSILALLLVLLPGLASAQASPHAALRAGDEAFARKDFAAAELHYRRAEEAAPSFQSAYNLGVTLGYLARAEEAAAAFELARERARAAAERGDASYNAGTARLDERELQASVADYAEALRARPSDHEARQNLAHALRQLRRQQQQQQQQQNDQQQPPPQEGEEEPPEDQGQRPDEQQSPQQESTPPQEGGGESADAEPQDGDAAEDTPAEPSDQDPPNAGEGGGRPLPAEEAERLLELAADQERQTGERMRLGEQATRQPAKDW